MTAILETERLILRKPNASDADGFIALLTSDRARFLGGPVDLGKAWRAFASIVGHWDIHGYGVFTMESRETGEALGSVGPWFPGNWPEPELSWSLWTTSAEGKGFAYEGAKAALIHMRDAWGILSPVSYIDADNTRSIKLAERLGAVVDPTAQDPFKDKEGDGFIYRHPKEAMQ